MTNSPALEQRELPVVPDEAIHRELAASFQRLRARCQAIHVNIGLIQAPSAQNPAPFASSL